MLDTDSLGGDWGGKAVLTHLTKRKFLEDNMYTGC
jgi:hypothetical protein